MAFFYVVPIGAIFFIFIILMIWRRQRQRNRTVFVAPRNYVMPVQPSNFNSVNSQYGTPMANAQPNPSPYPYNGGNTPQYFPSTPQQFPQTPQQFPQTPQQFPPTPQQFPPTQFPPTPQQFPPTQFPQTPQHLSPSPITVPLNTQPNPATSSDGSDMNRMLQVQSLMLEIHRLESESREGNQQRLQELKQRVGELNGTDGRMPVSDSFLQPPPAYDVKQSRG